MSISSIEKLKEFARKTGRQIEFKENSYPPVPPNNITYHRRTLYIPNGSSYFVCYADSKEMGPQGLFSGVFIPIEMHASFRVVFRKKDILNKINIFQKKKYLKSGIPGLDSKVSIESQDQASVKRILQDRKMQNKIINGLNSADAMIAGVNHMNIDFVPEFKGRSHFGIYTQMTWIEDTKTIENLFRIIEE
jgi:hypothetical protein